MGPKKTETKNNTIKENKTVDIGRNDPCHCGSGKKYKKCHLSKDKEAESKRLIETKAPPTEPEKKKPGAQSSQNKFSGPGKEASSHLKKSNKISRFFFNRKSGGG